MQGANKIHEPEGNLSVPPDHTYCPLEKIWYLKGRWWLKAALLFRPREEHVCFAKSVFYGEISLVGRVLLGYTAGAVGDVCFLRRTSTAEPREVLSSLHPGGRGRKIASFRPDLAKQQILRHVRLQETHHADLGVHSLPGSQSWDPGVETGVCAPPTGFWRTSPALSFSMSFLAPRDAPLS